MAPRKVFRRYLLMTTRTRQNGVPESLGNRGSLTTYDRSVGHLRLQSLSGFTPFNSTTVVLQPGLISQANGSAYIETERTKIACAVCVQSAVALQLRRQTKWRSADMVLANRKAQVTVNVAA